MLTGPQQLSFKEPNYSSQAMQPKSHFSSGNLAHKASTPRSLSTQFEELNYSTQAMQPKIQFSSGIQPTEPQQLCFKEPNYSTQVMQPRSRFSSGMQPTEPQQHSFEELNFSTQTLNSGHSFHVEQREEHK